MKRIFNTNYNHQTLDIGLLLLRVGIACFMLTHGIAKVNSALTSPEIQFGDPIGLGMKTSFFLAVFAEVICSVLLLFGLLTRLALIPLITTMMVAIFIVHANDGFQRQEMPAIYLLVYVFLLFSGPGRFSIDSLIARKTNRRRVF